MINFLKNLMNRILFLYEICEGTKETKLIVENEMKYIKTFSIFF